MHNARARVYRQRVSFSRSVSRSEHRDPVCCRLFDGRVPAMEYRRTSPLCFGTDRPTQCAAHFMNLFAAQTIEKRQRQGLARHLLCDVQIIERIYIGCKERLLMQRSKITRAADAL